MGTQKTGGAVRVEGAEFFVRMLRTRLPFRYGITEMTEVPHLWVRARVRVGGRAVVGYAGDHLPPKWFTKNPGTSFEEDLAGMRRSIGAAFGSAVEAGQAESVFALWQRVYEGQHRWAAGIGMEALLAGFGVSLVERVCIDAVCRDSGRPFGTVLREGGLGLRVEEVHPVLAGVRLGDFLPEKPVRSMFVRHTVGMGDRLRGGGGDPGRPVSLESNVERYGLSFFKVKLGGNPEPDLDRVREVWEVVRGAVVSRKEGGLSLDGNESYRSVAEFRGFWEGVKALDPELSRRVLWVEQPFGRGSALSEETRSGLRAWPDRPGMIIDESDGAVGDLPRALECGYSGVSHKNCKGVFRSVANAALLELFRREGALRRPVLSAEDLCTVGPYALLQDLAVASTLGVRHIERNGHHYFPGLAPFPDSMQRGIEQLHPDLFGRENTPYPALRVVGGRVSVESVVEAPFGTGYQPDCEALAGFRLEDWPAD